VNGEGKIDVGERFFKYKQEVNGLKSVVETHFSKVINQIEAGLPEIMDDHEIKTAEIDRYNKATIWTCPTCTNVNQMSIDHCQACRTKRPHTVL
jgi:hypothetical protein